MGQKPIWFFDPSVIKLPLPELFPPKQLPPEHFVRHAYIELSSKMMRVSPKWLKHIVVCLGVIYN
jgi:hypothetical protein